MAGPEEKPYFEFPLAGQFQDVPPTDLVDTLVVQVVSAADIEYLDEENSPIHPGDRSARACPLCHAA